MRRARHLVHDAETDVNLQLYQAEFLESPGKAAVGYSTGSGELPLKKIEYEGRVALVEGKLDAACARVTRGWGRVLERAVDADAPEAYKTPLACNMHGEGRRGGAWEGEGGGGAQRLTFGKAGFVMANLASVRRLRLRTSTTADAAREGFS